MKPGALLVVLMAAIMASAAPAAGLALDGAPLAADPDPTPPLGPPITDPAAPSPSPDAPRVEAPPLAGAALQALPVPLAHMPLPLGAVRALLTGATPVAVPEAGAATGRFTTPSEGGAGAAVATPSEGAAMALPGPAPQAEPAPWTSSPLAPRQEEAPAVWRVRVAGGEGSAGRDATAAVALAGAAAAGGLLVLVGLLSLLRKPESEVLSGTRRVVYDLVAASPGITASDISARAGVTHQTVTYHLAVLQGSGLLTTQGDGGRKRYLVNGSGLTAEERRLLPLVKDPEAMALLRLVCGRPGITKTRVAEALGVSRQTVNWHLGKLLDADLVREHREGTQRALAPTGPGVEEAVARAAARIGAKGRAPPAGHPATGPGALAGARS